MPVHAIIIIVVLVLILALIIAVSFKFAFMVLKPHANSYEFQLDESTGNKRFTKEYIKSLDLEHFEVESRYGYTLHGIIQENEISSLPGNRKKVAVLCHGYTSGKITMSGYAKHMMDLGFTCVMYDHRNHGENVRNSKTYTSMGYFEKYDLQTVLDFCYKRFGEDINILTYGESMGSAIVLSLYEIDDRPSMTVADCGYSNLKELFKFMLGVTFKVPSFPILPIAGLIIRIFGHYRIEDIVPERGVMKTSKPIFFVHGDADSFIPCSMSEHMSTLGNGPRGLYICPGAEHALSEVTCPDEYYSRLGAFISQYFPE